MTTSIQTDPRESLCRVYPRVLLVDDEPHVLAVGRAMLDAHAFNVVTASSGEQALEIVQQAIAEGDPIGTVVLDLTMPGSSSGFDVLGWLQTVDPNLSVIACSGYFQEDVKDLCQSLGFMDVLPKPFTIESLCRAVRRALKQGSDAATQEQEVMTAA